MIEVYIPNHLPEDNKMPLFGNPSVIVRLEGEPKRVCSGSNQRYLLTEISPTSTHNGNNLEFPCPYCGLNIRVIV